MTVTGENCVVCGRPVEPGKGAQAVGIFPALHAACIMPKVGGACVHCAEPVLEGEQDPDHHSSTVHYECAARAVIGSVGHLNGKCSCYGGDEEDPPGLTRRQAAKAALSLFRSRWRTFQGEAIDDPESSPRKK